MGVDSGVKSVIQEKKAQTVGKASIPWYDVRSLALYWERQRKGRQKEGRQAYKGE